MTTNHIPGFVPSMLLNAETLLGSKPTGMSPLEAELLTRALDAVIPVMHTPPETAYSGALTQAPAEHYAGGPDGPIREPGDTVPTRSDIYTDDELCASLDLHAARAAKRGDYGAAADLGLARDALATRADEVEQASVVVHKLLTKLEFLGYATCAESPRCLLAHEHPGGCVFSHEEAARMRKNDAEADDHD